MPLRRDGVDLIYPNFYVRCTQVCCGEPNKVVCALPAVSLIENVVAAVKIETRAMSPRSAVDCAEIVQTVVELCVIELMREILVNVKSTPLS